MRKAKLLHSFFEKPNIIWFPLTQKKEKRKERKKEKGSTLWFRNELQEV